MFRINLADPGEDKNNQITSYPSLLLLQTACAEEWPIPVKTKTRKKIKIDYGKLIFRPQQKQQQNNIIPFPSFITNKTKQNRNGNKTH